MTPLVPYFQGMFENELATTWLDSHLHELEATCHHEAAHAAAAYVFGYPIYRIGVSAEYDDDISSVAYGGEFVDAKGRIHLNRINLPRYFHIGMICASGPAGERRYRSDNGVPMRMLGVTENDHHAIDAAGKMLEWKHLRSRHAYQRLVWYAAQRLIQRDDVWSAVSELADRLHFAVSDQIPDEVPGSHWVYVAPRDAHHVFRRAGLTRGMFRSAPAEMQAA